ncbi:chemosensory receptor c [Plakobranchus ocellatus]|uniref:Chemosensory receptor c n=1 Tax=Plakobranchus ocellatus TaxID=259542 RepID=A0AAV3ZEW0_9GAST|nr:chemosensory receptor c [Plakobranchus ocellatus]
MEFINSTSFAPDTREDIISETAVWILAITIRVCLSTVFSVSAFITNIINFIVFKRMSIDDSAKESFLILSIADGSVGFIGTIAGVCNGLRYLASAQVQASMYALYFLLLAAATVPSMTSLLSTVVLAVVRCCSVVLPFRVKTLFAARRQRIFICSATAILIGTVTYSLMGTKINIAPNLNTNVSRLQLTFHPEYVQRSWYTDIYRGLVFYLSFLAVTICLFFMIIALKHCRYEYNLVYTRICSVYGVQCPGHDRVHFETDSSRPEQRRDVSLVAGRTSDFCRGIPAPQLYT